MSRAGDAEKLRRMKEHQEENERKKKENRRNCAIGAIVVKAMPHNAKRIKAESTSGWLPEVPNKMNEAEGKMYSIDSIQRITGRKILSRQAKPVSQDQVRQCEHDIQFCGLFFQASIARLSESKLPFYDRKNMFYLCTN